MATLWLRTDDCGLVGFRIQRWGIVATKPSTMLIQVRVKGTCVARFWVVVIDSSSRHRNKTCVTWASDFCSFTFSSNDSKSRGVLRDVKFGVFRDRFRLHAFLWSSCYLVCKFWLLSFSPFTSGPSPCTTFLAKLNPHQTSFPPHHNFDFCLFSLLLSLDTAA